MTSEAGRSKRMLRVRRSIDAIASGEAIFKHVTASDTRARLVDAAKNGAAPISVISAYLARLPSIDAPAVKQFAGLCVRAVLEEEGFEIDQRGVRLSRDAVFRTGSTYRRSRAGVSDAGADMIERVVGALTEAEALRLARALETAHPGIARRARARVK